MNLKAFFVDALSSALELGVGTPSDVLRHVTPDVLAAHLPRPLWARLLTAALGAPRVDAQLVVETIGIANLCEHVPSAIIWGCIAELGSRSLGQPVTAAPTIVTRSGSAPVKSMLAPPPEAVPKPASTPPRGSPLGPAIPKPTPARGAPVAIGPNLAPTPTPSASQPLGDVITELEEERPAGSRPRSPSQRFRQSGTGVRTLGGQARRPQAAATPSARGTPGPQAITPRRTGTEPNEYETETAVQNADWADKEIAVDDEQLVDWQTEPSAAVSSAITGDDDFSDLGNRKR